jgi:hypothetical protein
MISDHYSFDDNDVYAEWFTFDTMEDDVSRTAMNVWDVFGSVGGNQQVIIFVAALVMSYYS